MAPYASIKIKLGSVATFISRDLKNRDDLEAVSLDLLHNDCREETHQIVMSLFNVVNDLFSNLLENFNNPALQDRFTRACDTFDKYCIAYRIDPVVVIKVDTGNEELECYYVNNQDKDLGVVKAA